MGAMRNVTTRPMVVAVGPDQSICFGPPSDGLYTLSGDYYTAPTVMVADDDEPTGLPARYHMLIVYKTMIKYAGYESAPEVYSKGDMETKKMMSELEAARLTAASFAGSL